MILKKCAIQLTHKGRDKMVTILQTTPSNAFLEWKPLYFGPSFSRLFPPALLTVSQFGLNWYSLTYSKLRVADRHRLCTLSVLYSPINSLGPSDAIWRQRSGSTLAQVMACCLTAPSHCLNQCWLIISEVQRHSPGRNFVRDVPAINRWNELENHTTKTSLKSPRGQWVNTSAPISC